MKTRDLLLARIAAYIERTGITERTFGFSVTRDVKWVARLRRGQATLASIEKAEAVLDGERPIIPVPSQAAPARQVAA